MRCRKAREKLIELAGDFAVGKEEEALREHLNRCPSCARLAHAEQLLVGDLEQLRHVQSAHPMTIEQVREGIAIREKRHKNTNLGVRIMRQASDTIYRRPRLSLATATVFAMLLASVLVPVGTGQSVRYEVAFAAPASGLMLDQENAERLLTALEMGDAQVRVHLSESGVEYRIAPLEDSGQVRRLIAMLDSLGGVEAHQVPAAAGSRDKRTIWELLLDDNESSASTPPTTIDISVDSFEDLAQGSFTLWVPVGDQSSDSLSGILIDRHGETTDMTLVGMPHEPDDRGWNKLLNGNTVLHTRTPEGEQAAFDLTNIGDVRKLEKMGYNFWLMEFGTPGEVPVPGMGPKLNEIEPNPFNDETVVEFMVPCAYQVLLLISDQHGREVRILSDDIVLAGIYHFTWDGRDADGNRAAPGTYLCRFIAGDYEETQEIMVER